MKHKLFPEHDEDKIVKTCKTCNQKFENRASDYCSSKCAEKQQYD